MINTGVCSGMSVQEMMEKMPNEWAAWRADPFRYRFAGGESYKDVVQNVEPLILDLERQVPHVTVHCTANPVLTLCVVCLVKTTPILVVSHLSTLQVLFGYFVGCPVDSFATLSLPRHTVVQLTPNQYGWKVDLIPLHGLDGSASPAAAVLADAAGGAPQAAMPRTMTAGLAASLLQEMTQNLPRMIGNVPGSNKAAYERFAAQLEENNWVRSRPASLGPLLY